MKTARRPLKDAEGIPIAISYLRFSTWEQRKGDSTRRQTEATEKWCEKNGIALDRTLSCRDAGRSAYRDKHRSDKGALGRFLELVNEGKVPRGSYLVIENLDRLSREEERTALRLWLDILDGGVNIVQLNPETVFRHERSDMTDIIRAIIELSRGHSESRAKSARTRANWEGMYQRAREGKAQLPRRKDGRVTKALTTRLPSWIVVGEEGGLRLDPERAATVRRIFAMATAGFGSGVIVKKLTEDKVVAFGARDADEEGRWKSRPGVPMGSGEWRVAYVRKILKDRRVLGELLPRDRDEKPTGDPIVDYYPRVISDKEFSAARAAVGGRTLKAGRIGEDVANLFGGLLKNARDGSTYYAATRSDGNGVYRTLLNASAVEKKSKAYTFSLAVFESAILSKLKELNPRDFLPSDADATTHSTTTVLAEGLKWLRRRKAELAAELLKGDVVAIAAALRSMEAREIELVAALDEAEEEIALPVVNTWAAAQTLAELMENCPKDEREDVRLRLRAALRRIIDEVWIMVVPRGKVRICEAQIWFSGGTSWRSYFIVHRPQHANKCGRTPAMTHVSSALQPDCFAEGLLLGKNDLRDAEEAGWELNFLENYPVEFLNRTLAGDKPLVTGAEWKKILAEQGAKLKEMNEKLKKERAARLKD